MHDTEHAHEIAEVVLAELGEVRKTFAENIKVILQEMIGRQSAS